MSFFRSKALTFLSHSSEAPPFLLKHRSSKWFITLTVAVSVFCDIFLYGVIVPVVPFALEARVGISQSDIQSWVSILLATYGAALLVASAIWGYAADKTESRRWPFLAGLILLIAATAMLCVGNSLAVIVAGRALQGASSAVVWVTGLVIICDTVGQRHTGQYMGYVGLAMSVAILLAPLLGGVVYDRAGYYAVFAMCFAILGVDVVLRLFMIETKVAAKWIDVSIDEEDKNVGEKDIETGEQSQVEAKGQRTTAEMTMTDMTTTNSDSAAQLPPPNITLFPSDNTRMTSRMPPMIALLASPRLCAGLWCALIQAALLTSLDSTLPLRVAAIWAYDALGAGLIFLPLVIPSFLGPVVGMISDRYGAKVPTVLGFVGAVPFLVLLRFVYYNSIDQKVLMCALLALYGFSLSLCLTPIMAEVSLVVEAKEAEKPKGYYGKQGAYAQAYGLFNMAFAGGCLIGPIWGGLVTESTSWNTMTWSLALLSGITSLVATAYVGGWVGNREARWNKGGANALVNVSDESGHLKDEPTQEK